MIRVLGLTGKSVRFRCPALASVSVTQVKGSGRGPSKLRWCGVAGYRDRSAARRTRRKPGGVQAALRYLSGRQVRHPVRGSTSIIQRTFPGFRTGRHREIGQPLPGETTLRECELGLGRGATAKEGRARGGCGDGPLTVLAAEHGAEEFVGGSQQPLGIRRVSGHSALPGEIVRGNQWQDPAETGKAKRPSSTDSNRRLSFSLSTKPVSQPAVHVKRITHAECAGD